MRTPTTRKAPRPATIVDGVIDGERLIVTPLGERICIEIHTSKIDERGETLSRVKFIEISTWNARDLADALNAHADRVVDYTSPEQREARPASGEKTR